MKYLVLTLILASFQITEASSIQLPLYYGQEFLIGYQDHSLKNDELKNKLFQIMSGGHIKNNLDPDTIVSTCNYSDDTDVAAADTADTPQAVIPNTKCQQHHALGYEGARRKLFGDLYLKQLSSSTYSVTDVYCERTYTDEDFKSPTFGPDQYPISGNIINTEHTWPQSRFTGRFNTEMQKSDLHHLFPTDSEMNSRRSSLRFGNVARDMEKLKCPQNRLGQQAEGGTVFQVPNAHRGNVARAIFYFATRYQMKLSPSEEKALRQWNNEDPVDEEEFTRNEKIEHWQGNRNPYIDFPDLVERIDNFSWSPQNN